MGTTDWKMPSKTNSLLSSMGALEAVAKVASTTWCVKQNVAKGRSPMAQWVLVTSKSVKLQRAAGYRVQSLPVGHDRQCRAQCSAPGLRHAIRLML
jgi:hypothetical protein